MMAPSLFCANFNILFINGTSTVLAYDYKKRKALKQKTTKVEIFLATMINLSITDTYMIVIL